MLGREKKASTVSRRMSSVRAFYRYMVKMYLIKEDISERLQIPRQEQDMPEALTVEEVRLLMEQPLGDRPRQQRDRALSQMAQIPPVGIHRIAGQAFDLL